MTSKQVVIVRALLLSAALTPLAGCFWFGGSAAELCEPLESLQTLPDHENIVVPDDLDNLDETRALKIPDATSPPRKEGTCIDDPPRFNEVGV